MIKTERTARRYAKALYSLALDQSRMDPIRDDLDRLLSLLGQSPDLAQFIENRRVTTEQQMNTLALLFEGKADPLTFRFLCFLAQKSRLNLLGEIGAAFQAMDDRRRGILKVRVAAAQELTAEENTAIVSRLQTRFQKKVQADMAVDPALLGGFKIYVGDSVYDFSLTTQLQTLKEKLINA